MNKKDLSLLSVQRVMALASLATLLVPLLVLGCQNKEQPNVDNLVNDKTAAKPDLKPTEFDSARAFEHVRRLVELGPHPPGSSAIKQAREYITKELTGYGLKVQTDSFRAHTPNPRFPEVEMVNLIAEIPGQQQGVIILASHYDTKWFPDIEFVGANDSGSSTGALLELARQLANSKPKYTLWLVFFDGEEAMNGPWIEGDNTYGSRHMAERLTKEGKIRDIKGMILLDMIGDRELNVVRDAYSTSWMSDIIWRTAARLGYAKHFDTNSTYLEDDHIPFLRAGVPAVDIIDFSYGSDANDYWHTAGDTLDKLSPQSLKVIGDTVLHSLPEIAARFK
ncbi:MAG: M28 family peptidase [Acidobacteriota bacterium]